MSGYRPICDAWIMGRPKVKRYGSFPGGFLHRGIALLGVGADARVLHVCGGAVRQYPYKGLGPNHRTLDLDPLVQPDYLRDAREPFPLPDGAAHWDAALIDRPYSEPDADHYPPGRLALPSAELLIKNAIAVLPIGGRVGILDYTWPSPPKNATEVAVIAVFMGRRNRARNYIVFEKVAP